MLRRILAVVLMSTAPALAAGPVFIEIPTHRERGEGVYGDILSHSVEAPFGDAHGRPTNCHETTHGIHAHYRNEYRRLLGKPVNALYMLDGSIAVIEEPEFLVQNITQKIPQCLRGYRFKLYFVEQLRDWNDTPLYIWDEWTAYICGGECAVDDFARNGTLTGEDSVSGCLEFSVYAVATYLTARERVPEYLEQEPQFLAVLRHNLLRAEQVFFNGRDAFPSSKQDALYDALLNHEGAAEIRDCLRDEFDGIFLPVEGME